MIGVVQANERPYLKKQWMIQEGQELRLSLTSICMLTHMHTHTHVHMNIHTHQENKTLNSNDHITSIVCLLEDVLNVSLKTCLPQAIYYQ